MRALRLGCVRARRPHDPRARDARPRSAPRGGGRRPRPSARVHRARRATTARPVPLAVARRTAAPSRASNSCRSKRPRLGVAHREIGEPPLATMALRDVAHRDEVPRLPVVHRDDASRDQHAKAAAVPVTERELPDVLASSVELGVPGVELVAVLGRPEGEGRLGAEERVPVEAELVAETAVDRANAPACDDEEPVGQGREERAGGVPFSVERLVDGAASDPAEEDDERRGERERERRGGREPEPELRRRGLERRRATATAAAATATSTRSRSSIPRPRVRLMQASPVCCARTCARTCPPERTPGALDPCPGEDRPVDDHLDRHQGEQADHA